MSTAKDNCPFHPGVACNYIADKICNRCGWKNERLLETRLLDRYTPDMIQVLKSTIIVCTDKEMRGDW